jgi:hypothetical protein
VTADDFKNVRMYRYPCISDKAGYRQYAGHGSFVQNVRFLRKEEYVVSVGGSDGCAFVWRVVPAAVKS